MVHVFSNIFLITDLGFAFLSFLHLIMVAGLTVDGAADIVLRLLARGSCLAIIVIRLQPTMNTSLSNAEVNKKHGTMPCISLRAAVKTTYIGT